METIRELSGNVAPKSLYVDTPGASAFVSEALDAEDFDGVMYTLQVGANDEAPEAKVTECDTSGGTYADISGATFVLAHTATASRLYHCYVKKNKQYQKVSVTSTPTADIEYAVAAIGHGQKELPVS